MFCTTTQQWVKSHLNLSYVDTSLSGIVTYHVSTLHVHLKWPIHTIVLLVHVMEFWKAASYVQEYTFRNM